MPELTIDGRRVRVPAGATLLAAAAAAGVRVPTLCHLEGHEHHTSCMVCLVEDLGSGALLPACAAAAAEGQKVSTDSERARRSRRASLELLLSEHAGDCEAPCTRACPAHADVPRAIRRLLDGDAAGALAALQETLALPRTLAHVCPAPCERSCRRGRLDSPVRICALLREAAGSPAAAAAAAAPSQPGKRVAIVGAGPAGLAAAFHLARLGHQCVLLDEQPGPGGGLRQSGAPPWALEADVAFLEGLGVRFQLGQAVRVPAELEGLRARHDAVVLATGSPERLAALQPEGGCPGVFAVGNASRERPSRIAVQAAADGRRLAGSVGLFLAGAPPALARRRFDSRLGTPAVEELAAASQRALRRPARASAPAEARRCLQCDCARKVSCRLRELGDRLEADARRFPGDRPRPDGPRVLRGGRVSFEPGKCIRCGICVRIAERGHDRPGLGFSGRGFDLRVKVPFNDDIGAALPATQQECARRCPTGALAWER